MERIQGGEFASAEYNRSMQVSCQRRDVNAPPPLGGGWEGVTPGKEWRGYEGALGRFTQPDTIVPTGTQGTQAWDRYAFVNNNPVRYNDPTGHGVDCGIGEGCMGNQTNPNDPPTSGEGEDSGGDGSGEEGHKSCLDDIWECYKQGWDTAGSAWDTILAQDTPAAVETLAIVYLAFWWIAHGAVAVGVVGLVCAFTPGCAALVEGALGIGGAASADGDPTNEVRNLAQIANELESWLGDSSIGFRNEAGDFILRNAENTRKFRFDFNYTNPHLNPHMHLQWINEAGKWVGQRIFPIDVPPY